VLHAEVPHLVGVACEDLADQLEADLAKTEAAIERYLLSFEAGTLPEAVCGERVRRLGDKAAELRSRRAELEYEVLDAEAPTISRTDLDKIPRRVSDAIATGHARDEEGASAGARCRGSDRGAPSGPAVLPRSRRAGCGGVARPAGKGSSSVRVSAPGRNRT
jgi:hypothetical protein